MKKILTRATVFCIAFVFITQTVLGTGNMKDETVYVNLNTNGSIDKTIVVNAFKVAGSSSILDYGNYTNIKNLSGNAKPKVKGGYIEWQTNKDSDMFYYQGEVKNPELPWNFDITYTLDGKQVDGKKLVGKNGKVGITLQATANPDAESYFKENYLAQISVALDTEKCKNIDAPDAMIANVGSTKSLTFMVLPTLDKTYQITLDAKKFEMDSITIALVKVSDGILGNIDSVKVGLSSVSNSIGQLVTGTGELKNGASDLAQGLSMLDTGAQSLNQVGPMVNEGLNEFNMGLWSLGDGLTNISSGSTQVRNGLMELDSNSAEISNGISRIGDGLNQMTKNKQTVKSGLNELKSNKSSIDALKSGSATLKTGYKQIETGLNTMAGNAEKIDSGVSALSAKQTQISQLTSSGTQLQSSIDMILNAYGSALPPAVVQTLQASKQYASNANGAVNTLYASANTLGSAAQQLAGGANNLCANMKTLNGGMDTLCNGIDKSSEIYNAALSFGNSTLAMIEGAQILYNGVSTLQNGFDKYADGVGEIAENYIQLDNGIYDAETGISDLKSGFTTLQSSTDGVISSLNELTDSIGTLDRGAGLLYDGTAQMQSGTSSFTDMLDGADITSLISMSESAETVSFAAPGMVTPNSVQFVIKTPDLKIEDNKAAETEQPKLNFWQKLVALFTGKAKKS